MPLLTIVFTDVVGSTLTKRDESLGRDNRERDRAYLEKIQTPHFNMVRKCCLAHGGKEVSTIGDAFYLTFEDPVEGVRCAVEIQKRLASAPILTPLGPLQLRIGVHSGYPEPYEGGWHGADVDTAARVESAASACQILLSARTYELVRHMTDVKFRSRGEFALKGMDRITLWEADWDGNAPRRTSVQSLTAVRRKKMVWVWAGIAVLALIASDVAYRSKLFSIRKPTPSPQQTVSANGGRRSVAVLEFKNQSDPEHAWLGTAISEMLTTQLSAGDRLRIVPAEDVARTSVDLSLAGMIGFPRDVLARIRTNLGSDYVVSGSYSLSDSAAEHAIQVQLQLTDTQSGDTVWSSPYDGTVDQLSDLVGRIGEGLRARLDVQGLTDQDLKQADAAAPSNPDAIRLYSVGLAKLRAFDLLEARDRFQEAVRLEPQYAAAHAALANTWQLLGYDEKARDAAKMAFDLSGNLSQTDRRSIEARYDEITAKWEDAAKIYGGLWVVNNDEPKYALEQAHAQAEAGKGNDAIATLDDLRHAGGAAKDDPRIDYEEALAAEKLSDVKREHSAAARAAAKASKQGARHLASEAYWQDCSALLALGDPKAAETACQQANGLADLAGGERDRARALTVLANVLVAEGKIPQAMELRQDVLRIARQIGSRKDVTGALLALANLESLKGDTESAAMHRQEAITVAREINDKQQLLKLENDIADDLLSGGQYGEASSMYQESLATARAIGDKGGIAMALQNIGSLLYELGDLTEAEKSTQQAIDVAQKAELKSTVAASWNNLGDVRMARDDLAGARRDYEQALNLFMQVGDKADIAECRLSLAGLLVELGSPVQAEASARQAVAEFQLEGFADNEADAHGTVARALMAQGKLAEAQAETEHAATLTVQDPAIRISLAITSARVQAGAGRPREALQTVSTALEQASRLRLKGCEFEAQLAEDEIELSLTPKSSKGNLAKLANEAASEQFLLVARKADRLARAR